jgi:iron(III) transport system ATP-binding protein
MTPVAISLDNVTKRFGSHRAIDALSLDVEHGEFIVILGPSGCGKTTLLRLIAGLDAPDDGQISLEGRQVSQGGRSVVPPYRRRIGFVFQDLALWPHLTVQQHLQFVLDSGGLPRVQQSARIHERLELARMGELGDRYPHQLSGGEQQRVALARALVGEPSVLLLDEPLSSLDPDLRSELRAELARIHRASGVTTVYVTHDRDDATALASRTVQMRAGRITESATAPKEERR